MFHPHADCQRERSHDSLMPAQGLTHFLPLPEATAVAINAGVCVGMPTAVDAWEPTSLVGYD
mgnify:CR=1 FL=1